MARGRDLSLGFTSACTQDGRHLEEAIKAGSLVIIAGEAEAVDKYRELDCLQKVQTAVCCKLHFAADENVSLSLHFFETYRTVSAL